MSYQNSAFLSDSPYVNRMRSRQPQQLQVLSSNVSRGLPTRQSALPALQRNSQFDTKNTLDAVLQQHQQDLQRQKMIENQRISQMLQSKGL